MTARSDHTVVILLESGAILEAMQDCVNGYSCERSADSDPTDAPDFLTMEEAAQILRVGRNQVYELARVWRATGGERGVPVVEFGRLLRVPKAALLRLAGLAEP